MTTSHYRLNDEFSLPYSEITDKAYPSLPADAIALDGRLYLIDNKSGKYRRSGVNVVEQRNTSSNRDLLLLPQGVWRQMFESWYQGAGQSNLDRDDALLYRFHKSFGVDPWTKYRLSLLPETREIMDTGAGSKSWVQVLGEHLAVMTGDHVYWFTGDSAAANPPAPSVWYALPSPVVDYTSDGEFIYVLCQDGSLHKCDKDGDTTVTITWETDPAGTNYVDPASTPTFISYVNDYLLIGMGHVLMNITDPAKPVKVYTSPVPGFTWNDATAGDKAIYLSGGAGDRYVIHSVKVSDDGTHLMPAAVAGTLPDGEIAHAVGSYLGFVFVGTQSGVRMATADSTGALTLGALIPSGSPVMCFEGQDRFVWYGDQFNGTFNDGTNRWPGVVSGLSRMDLTVFTTTANTPAYATDLSTYHVGLTRSVTTWLGKRVFAMDGLDPNLAVEGGNQGGIYMESDCRMEAGWVTHGAVSFGVEDLKTGTYAQFKWEPMPNGAEIEMYTSVDNDNYKLLARNDHPGEVRSGNVTMNGQQFSRLSIGMVLHRSDNDCTQSPETSRWEFRALPVKGISSQWDVPIMNMSEIEVSGVKYNRNVNEELDYLVGLVQSGKQVVYQEGAHTYRVVPRTFEWVPEHISNNSTGWNGVFTIRIEEIR